MPFPDLDLIFDDLGTAEAILAGIAERIAGWTPEEGHVEPAEVEAVALAIVTAALVFRDEIRDRYADGFGEETLGIPRVAAAAASTTATFTFLNTDPATIPGGTVLVAYLADGVTTTELATAETVTKDAGVTTITGVEAIALEPGLASDGAHGTADTDFIGEAGNPLVSVVLDAPATGGSEEEDSTLYRGRVTDRAQRLKLLPITPTDHAAWATDTPGVARAFARNRYDPAHPVDNSRGHVALWTIDAEGAGTAGAVETALEASFTGIDDPLARIMHFLTPGYVPLTIAVAAVKVPDADGATLTAAIKSNLVAAFNPATFDTDATRAGNWVKVPSTQISAYEAAAAIDDLTDLRRVTSITLNGGATVALPAPLSLPTLDPDDITVTLT